jgi:hypothetical protein
LLVGRDLVRNLAAAIAINDQETNVDLHLEAALTLSGSVKDPSGAPVKNAMVRLNIRSGNRGGPFAQQQQTPVDTQGAFSISPLPQGQTYVVFVTATGYGGANQVVSSTETQTALLQLPPIALKLANLKLEGKVVDVNDKPVPDAQVTLNGPGQPAENTSTDSKGHFAFNHVCEGQATVFAFDQNNMNGMLQGNALAQGGDLDVVVKLGNNQGMAMAGLRQAPPRTSPLKEQVWTWAALRKWPQQHKTAVIALLCLQLTASLAAAGSILWLTRHRQS